MTVRLPRLTAVLAVLLGLASAHAAQQAGGELKLVILEGEGAVNNVRQRTAREVIVEVQDENDRPVAGAAVAFTLPDRGPTGLFNNGQRFLTTTTGPDGRARAVIENFNRAGGNMDLRVNASHQGRSASTIVRQTNMVAGMSTAAKASIWVGLLAGAGAAAAVALAGGDSNGNGAPAPRPQVTANPGSPSVGPPPGN